MDFALCTLVDRVAGQAAPAPPRSDADRFAGPVESWARDRGLILGGTGTHAAGRARGDRFAVRLFPTAPPDRVELFARWTTWSFALDDLLARGEFAASANTVHGLYADLLGTMRRGRARPGARPLEAALDELWRATGPLLGRDRRHRFLRRLEEHRSGRARKAVDRRTGVIPSLDDHPALRRPAGVPFLLDLIEPTAGVTVPARVAATPRWTALIEGTADIVAWSDDVASFPPRGAPNAPDDPHNLVRVLMETYRLDADEAALGAVDRICLRIGDVGEAARALPALLDRLRLADAERASVETAVDVLLRVPRAHADRLAESGRRSAPTGGHAP